MGLAGVVRGSGDKTSQFTDSDVPSTNSTGSGLAGVVRGPGDKTKSVHGLDFNIPSKALDWVWLDLSGDQETKQNKSVISQILTFHQQTALDWVCLELSGDLRRPDNSRGGKLEVAVTF